MSRLLLAALIAALPLASGVQAQAIARVVVLPAELTMTSGDTLRLRAQAVDAAGRAVPGAQIVFATDSMDARGAVSRDGLVASGGAGRFPIRVTATVPGAEPVSHRIEVRMTPGPAAYIEITPPVERLAVGQEWALTATPYSRLREIRREPITWRSSAPEILEVDAQGRLTARLGGSATITATGAGTSATLPVEVLGTPVAALELTPSTVQGRPGQVIRFRATARDAGGREVAGLPAVYSLSRKGGVISPDGIFVGYEPGAYTIVATVGSHRAEAQVHLAEPGR